MEWCHNLLYSLDYMVGNKIMPYILTLSQEASESS